MWTASPLGRESATPRRRLAIKSRLRLFRLPPQPLLDSMRRVRVRHLTCYKSSMRKVRRAVARCALQIGLVALAIATAGGAAAGLAVGDPAPAFSLPGSDGATHNLERYRGKQAVVVAWFPKAFTPG